MGSDLHGVNHGLDLLADAVGSHLHLLAEELCEAASAGREGELVLGALALGPPQVRRNLVYEKQASVLKKINAAEEHFLAETEDMSAREDLRQRGHPLRQGT